MPSVCGFTYGKNLVRLNYPIVESIRSILPICDEFVFLCGKSEDGTRDLIQSIDPRIQIHDSEWVPITAGGEVFRIEGNKSLQLAEKTKCDWGMFLFADEVIHEKELPTLRATMDEYASTPGVKALMHRVLQFSFDYQSIDTWMFRKVCRPMKLDGTVEFYGDGCGPGLKGGHPKRDYFNKEQLGNYVRWANTRLFHYGWVKSPEELATKFEWIKELYWGQQNKQQQESNLKRRFGPAFTSKYYALKNYRDTHPATMAARIAAHPQIDPRRNRWFSPRFYWECLNHGLKL